MSLTRDTLLTYLNQKMGLDTSKIDDQTLLFSTSLLDSFSMVDMIMFVERECSIKLKPTEVNLDNLDSVERILNFAESRSNA